MPPCSLGAAAKISASTDCALTGYGLNADRIPVVLASACYLADADWKCLWDTMPSAPVLPVASGTLKNLPSLSRRRFEVTLNMFDFLPFENDFFEAVQFFLSATANFRRLAPAS